MGKTPGIGTALHDIAAAIREQTEYFREDDTKDKNPADVEEIEETLPRPSYSRPSTHASGTAFDQLGGAVREMGRAYYGQQPEDTLVLSPEVVELLRVTPHQFVNPPRPPMRRGFSRDLDCRICQLKFRNPVHLIQIASLAQEED